MKTGTGARCYVPKIWTGKKVKVIFIGKLKYYFYDIKLGLGASYCQSRRVRYPSTHLQREREGNSYV
jgi:hypothetical protein